MYNNRKSSVILFKCRTNNLNHNNRKRFRGENTACDLCNDENEDLAHFLLRCPEFAEERKKNPRLQQPYEENEEKIIGRLMFGEDVEEMKKTIYAFWKIREEKLKIIST